LKPKGSRVLGVLAAALATMSAVLGLSSIAASASHTNAKQPIVIGLDATESGPFAPANAGNYLFFESWINYTNAHGGINGRHIKVINLDDRADPGQVLLNFETLWSSDHVLLIVKEGGNIPAPYPYIKSNNIPVIAYQGDPRLYSSIYPSIIADGDNIAEVGSEVRYWLTQIEHKHPSIVAIQYSPVYSTWNQFQVSDWQAHGASQVYLVPDQGVSADCTATILQLKSENVQFFNMEGPQAPQCVIAMSRLNWHPSDGAGGSATSSIGQTELIGQPYTGLVSGSPMSLYNGLPIFAHPSPANKTYEGNIQKYAPQYANYSFLNGTTALISYSLAQLATYDIQGTLNKYHRLTSTLLIKYAQSVRNWTNNLEPPVLSFSPTCKTGSDGTIWGYWHYNPHPTAFRPTMYMVPTSGPKWITAIGDLKLGKCLLTQQADQAYPNG
jgi:ABC-type branched-subunit amino acid transport system substrate-binding protein